MFEHSSIPQISDLSRCRLCFDNQTSLIHIFETTGSLNEVARSISEVLNFEISAEDHFPRFVCSYCSAKLFDFKAFKAKCYSLRETYKLILQRKAESVREVDGGMPVAENMESKVFLERNVAEPNHKEVSLHNVSPLLMKIEDAVVGDGIGVSEQIETEQDPKVSPYNEESLPLKVEHTVNDDRIGVSEQVEREQKSKDSAFNMAECPIKTELVEDELLEEAEMSEEAENEQIPERHDNSPQSRKQVWFQMNPAESEVHMSSEQSDAEHVPESSSYHLDGYPISNRKLGAEGEVIYLRTCSSVSGMDFPVGAADVTIPEMDDKSSNVASDPLEGIDDDTEVSIKDEMDIDEWVMPQDMLAKEDILENVKSEAGEEVLKDTKDFIEIEEHQQDEIQPEKDTSKVSVGMDFKHNDANIDAQSEELEELQSSESSDINSSECLGQMNENFENVSSITNSSVVSTSGISWKNNAKEKMCEESVKNVLFTKKESFLSSKSKSGDNSAKSGSSSSGRAVQSKRKQFVCDLCNKNFLTKLNLSNHVRVHYDDRPFKCRECGKSYKHERSKIEHGLRHLKKQKENEGDEKRKTKKSLVCEICKKEFSSQQSLHNHSNMHKNKYSCTFCGKRFGCKHDLLRHLMIHTNEKPFSCEVCKRTFNRKGSLKTHITIHSDDRSFQCNVCDKRFKTKQRKKRHELYHLRRK